MFAHGVLSSEGEEDLKPYYEQDGITIYHGDALALFDEVDTASVDCVILDPPYSFESISVRGRDDGAAGTSGAPTMLFHQTLLATRRVLKDGGIAPILHQWRRGPDVSYLTALAGLRLSACVVWTRGRVGTGGLFRSSWDPILVGTKGSPTLRNRAAISNVLHVEPLTGEPHPYAKPPGLWQHFTQRIPAGGVVLDPFMGLGAAGIAAIKEGHRFIGFEVDERYCEIAVQRLAQGVLELNQ
jgi:DNA modification methylase